MKVAGPIMLDGFSERELFLTAALASKAENNDPIELPIFHYLDEKLADLDWQDYSQKQFIPFDPVRKCTEAVIEHNGDSFLAVKGAASLELIGLIPLYDPPRDDSKAVIAEMINYGVQVKMVTGDNLAIAKEVGRLLDREFIHTHDQPS